MQSNSDGRVICAEVLLLKLSFWLYRSSWTLSVPGTARQGLWGIFLVARFWVVTLRPGTLLRTMSSIAPHLGTLDPHGVKMAQSWWSQQWLIPAEYLSLNSAHTLLGSQRVWVIQGELSLKWISKTMRLTYESLGIWNESFYILGIHL